MKNILIDCTTLSKKTDGLTQYSLSIILELLRNSTSKYTLICRVNELPENYLHQLLSFNDNCCIEYVDIKNIGPKRDIQFKKWYKKNKHRFDFFYEPSAQYPSGVRGGIYTIHDILYEEFPEKLGKISWLKRIYLHNVVKRGLKRSDFVVAVSDFTKSEILKYHKKSVNNNKIHVIYEGYEHLNSVKLIPEDNFVKTILHFSEKYFLYIGSSRGHKNLHNLFLAYKSSGVNWKLVIVGRMDRLEDSDKKLVQSINSDIEKIIFTDWINDSQMYTILSKANAFIFPSKSEGFGIPILEAYYFNVPLLCSDIPVFKEVTGNACISFNPFDINDISNCLNNFSKMDEKEICELLEKQKKQLEKYSWQIAANKIYDLLDQ